VLRNLTIQRVALELGPTRTVADDTATVPTFRSVANSSTLAQLSRLPDTAQEIREIARTLKADQATDVFLGERASERTVKTMNLADRRVIAFATHGLVPGDLNGLEEPAPALSAPEVANDDGDGLLTMGEILGLKLDADWVVLSACNSAAGNGAGTEAISGLGRAFFYAGDRSLNGHGLQLSPW
jgi:CHAT domain-containing protein